MDFTLGFDVSTRYVGYCILGVDGSYVDLGYLDLSKQKSLYQKLDSFTTFIRELKASDAGPNFSVFVEAPLARSNNQHVVNLLQRWNGMVCVELYRTFGMEPELLEHRSARKIAGIKVVKGLKGNDLKKHILEHIQSMYLFPEEKIEYKRTGNYKDYMYDMADAAVVAYAGWKKDE